MRCIHNFVEKHPWANGTCKNKTKNFTYMRFFKYVFDNIQYFELAKYDIHILIIRPSLGFCYPKMVNLVIFDAGPIHQGFIIQCIQYTILCLCHSTCVTHIVCVL